MLVSWENLIMTALVILSLFCFHLHKNDLLLSRQAFLLSSLYFAWSLGLSMHTYVQILCVLCIFVWVCVDDCAVHTFMHDCPCAVLCAVMCAGKRTCTNTSVYTETSACIFTFHLRFILSQAPLLPPQLSMWSHHLRSPGPRLSLRRSFPIASRSLAVLPPFWNLVTSASALDQ